MNIDNRATKVHIKSLSTLEALELFERYKIPSPQKECLIAMVYGNEGYKGCDYLAEHFNINIGFWTFGRRLKEGLESFRKAKKYIDSKQ